MISKIGVMYYFYYYPYIYQELEKRHLTDKWIHTNIEKQFKEIAHNVRDTKRNRTVKLDRIYPKHQLNLFSVLSLKHKPTLFTFDKS